MKIRITLLSILTAFAAVSFTLPASAQKKEKYSKLLKKADDYFNTGKLREAAPLYEKLYSMDSTDVSVLFPLGMCYLNSPAEKTKAIPYFEKATRVSDTIPDVFYYLGQAYHINNQFDEAITFYKNFLSFITSGRSGNKLKQEVERKIQQCNFGKVHMENPQMVIIENLGPGINSEYPDYAPLITADEGMMVLTSRRKGSTGGQQDENNEYFEDIYFSKRDRLSWGEPSKIDSTDNRDTLVINRSRFEKSKSISNKINTKYHDAALAFSADGQKLFIYRNEDIYMSSLNGTKWSEPVKLGSNVNTKGQEPSITLSADEKTVYFVSDRRGGYGGKDIYKSELMADSTWGPAKNLGRTINTSEDEDGPFIHPDGKTLYFSSRGHTSMGGYDIFKSVFEDKKWSQPQNLGFPVNTANEDLYYVVSAKGDHGYFSSIREEGYGHMDIYMIHYMGVNIPLTEVKGLVLGGDSLPLAPMGADITVIDEQTKKVVGKYSANSASGKYLLIFPPGKNYSMLIEAPGYLPHTEGVYIPNQDHYFQLYQEIHLFRTMTDKEKFTQKVELKNAFFDISSIIDSFPEFSSIEDRDKAYEKFVAHITKYSPGLLETLSALTDSIPKVTSLKERNTLIQSLITKVKNIDTTLIAAVVPPVDSLPKSGTVPPADSILIATEINATLYFDFKYALLNEPARKDLDRITKAMKENPAVKVTISGHTDSIGSESYNQRLSELRAGNVAGYLAAKGISKKRLTWKGLGEGHPILSNATEEGRQANRRVYVTSSQDAVEKSSVIPSESKVGLTKTAIFGTILFYFNQSVILPESELELENSFQILSRDTTINVEINGHTDNTGSEAYNEKLSRQRANAIADYLVKKGISRDRIRVKGNGESVPAASNETEEGKKQNRRVVFYIIP